MSRFTLQEAGFTVIVILTKFNKGGPLEIGIIYSNTVALYYRQTIIKRKQLIIDATRVYRKHRRRFVKTFAEVNFVTFAKRLSWKEGKRNAKSMKKTLEFYV